MSSWRARLDALPQLSVAADPTPLVRARSLSAMLGGPDLWFKRDDLIPVAFGGNKVRSLSVIIAEALRHGADTIVTGAGPLSNHVRASAGMAALAQLRCIAVYWGSPPARVEGNHLLTRLLGAEIRFTNDPERASTDRGIEAAVADVLARCGKPYVIPRGGACALATLAHVLAVREVLDQCASLGVMPQVVVMAVGGSATLAGWILGTSLFGATWRLEAVTVSRPAEEASRRAFALAAEAAAIIDCPTQFGRIGVTVHNGFLGDGYGIPSAEGQGAIVSTARAEGVFLDPVYTGKAMAGYRRLLAGRSYDNTETVLFLHTGGAPGLFTASVENMA